MNPIDWGNSPIVVGLIRGIIAAILIGILQALIFKSTGTNVTWESAVTAGAISGIPTLLALIGYGAADQNRANHGVVIPGDVPVASSELRVTKVTTKP